ncbi:hypothetical protein [uncultured Nostoc sp.]|uniref:hypothetical protein n=1 Tax=uncultured Nostoc sp. TaxID=340711 RepID=UPI0035CA7EC7
MLGNVEMRDDVQMTIQLGPGSKDKDKISQVSHFCTIYQTERGRNETGKQASTE